MPINTLANNSEKRKRLELELEALTLERTKLLALKNDIRLATELHAILCSYSHEDRCVWFYEEWDNLRRDYSARSSYLEKAQALMEAAPEKTIDELLTLVTIIHRG